MSHQSQPQVNSFHGTRGGGVFVLAVMAVAVLLLSVAFCSAKKKYMTKTNN